MIKVKKKNEFNEEFKRLLTYLRLTIKCIPIKCIYQFLNIV